MKIICPKCKEILSRWSAYISRSDGKNYWVCQCGHEFEDEENK